LLAYLETGALPWRQENWPLREKGPDAPEAEQRDRYPMISDLIDIAILDKKPEQVLRWYGLLPKKQFGWYAVNEDDIATAVQKHAPDRAIAIWKSLAEDSIAEIRPSAYHRAAGYLRKARKIMIRRKRQKDWVEYLRNLREKHARKRRLIEILTGLEGQTIMKKKGQCPLCRPTGPARHL
jgi:uncharacterized Zn finger protein